MPTVWPMYMIATKNSAAIIEITSWPIVISSTKNPIHIIPSFLWKPINSLIINIWSSSEE